MRDRAIPIKNDSVANATDLAGLFPKIRAFHTVLLLWSRRAFRLNLTQKLTFLGGLPRFFEVCARTGLAMHRRGRGDPIFAIALIALRDCPNP